MTSEQIKKHFENEMNMLLDKEIVNPLYESEIPPNWKCPNCGEHTCPGCLPSSQNLSCFF